MIFHNKILHYEWIETWQNPSNLLDCPQDDRVPYRDSYHFRVSQDKLA